MTVDTVNVNVIPHIEIQTDAIQVLADARENGGHTDETVWMYVNGKRHTLAVTSTTMTDDESGVRLQQRSGTQFELRRAGKQPLQVRFPLRHHTLTPTGSYSFTSVTWSDEKVILGTTSGDILNLNRPMEINSTACVLQGAHLSDIVQLKLFPSNEVLLSVGLETLIKVWGVNGLDDGVDAVRVLSHVHKMRVTDTAFIGAGRNLVSVGYDGRIVMWEVGSGKSVWVGQRVRCLDDACLCVTVAQVEGVVGGVENGSFFECEGKLIMCGHLSGVVSVWNCGNRLSLGEFVSNEEGIAVCGLEVVDGGNGVILCLGNGEIRKLKYSLGDSCTEVVWKCLFEYDGGLEVRKLTVWKGSVYVLTNRYFVKVRVEDGFIEEMYVGIDEPVFDFAIDDRGMVVVGKRNFICSYDMS